MRENERNEQESKADVAEPKAARKKLPPYLILAIIALALRLRQARLRRERRRRRKRSGGAPRRRSNGTRREPSACAGSPGRRSALGVRR